jgi:hypothetical protein
MADLEFDIEWLGPESTQIPEHEATWAALRILVDGKAITRFYDERLESVRRTLIVPVYPLAEWLASHWWNLLYESVTSGRTDDADYAHRHNLRYGRSGYALPDVQFTPSGESVSVQWTAKRLAHYETEFLEDGQAWVKRSAFEHELTQVLDMVTHRLDQRGVKNTPLQEDWTYIRTSGKEERAFCEVAARLGFHPYSVPDAEEKAILDVANRLPESLYPSFFGAAHASRITDQADRLIEALESLRALNTRADDLVHLKGEVPPYTPRYAPWEEGYEYARMLRGILGKESATFPTTRDVTRAFFLDSKGTQESVKEYNSGHLFTTLVVSNERGVPGFAIDKHRDDAKKFAFCRGMFEYLNAVNGQPHMVTREQSERQKRNRAFAAEFLAPSSLLTEGVTGSMIDEEDVEDIAEKFGVSSLVIQHQLINHHIVDEIIS